MVLLALSLSYVSVHGQVNLVDQRILDTYDKGFHQSLRDVFLMLGENSSIVTPEEVRKGFLFDIQDANFNSTAPKAWLSYYYEHKDQIQFYPEWNAFLRNDLPFQNLPYAILEDEQSSSLYISKARLIYDLIQSKSINKAIATANSLSLPETIYSQRILIEIIQLIRSTEISCKKKTRLYCTIIPHLLKVGDQHSYQQITEIKNDPYCGNGQLQKVLNQIEPDYSSILTQDNLSTLLTTLSKSQFTAHIKETIYSQHYNIYPSFFNHKIDFYGKLLSAVPLGNEKDEDELIYQLISDESPKALLYIATRWYIYAKEKHPRACVLLEIINGFIDHRIQVNTADGRALKVNCETKDLLSKKSILAYWINNHRHYEWNSEIKKYVNKSILKKDRQQLVQLYKNLNKDNTAFALKSYWQLISSDPILLAEVDKTYSKKLLNYNSELPSRKYKYLIQLAWLIEYCKSNGTTYMMPSELQAVTEQLINAHSIQDKLKIENEIIKLLTPKNITAFEIWSIVHSAQSEVKYSATRITNIFYKNNLEYITKNEDQFLLYLKKANLFKKFGDHGSSKYYINKSIDQVFISTKQLNSLRSGILDEDILSSISYIIKRQSENSGKTKAATLADYIKSPSSFDNKSFAAIDNYSSKSINRLFSVFHETQNPKERNRSLKWISSKLPNQGIGFLIKLISNPVELQDEDGVNLDCTKRATQVLALYSQSDKHHKNVQLTTYKKQFQKIFNQELANLVEAKSTKSATVNKILNSNFYTANHRSTIIKTIPKINPARSIASLKLDPKLSIDEVQYLLPKIQSKNALNYLLKITSLNKNDKLISFLIATAKEKGTSEAGKFFNTLFKKNWFVEYIDDNETSLDLKHQVQWILTNYWEGDDILSAFEEEQTMLNIIKIELAGKSLEEKINLILSSFVDNEIKLHIIEKMIYQIDYESIPILLAYYDEVVEIGGTELFHFISHDFGIPIEDFSNRNLIQSLKEDISILDEKALYHKYLNKVGISIKTKNGLLDLRRAYSIITEDLVRPFVGTGGSVRDEYVFTTIKLLEKEFGKTFGFHAKLNESQSFYKYTSKKRAEAWATFLEKEMKDLL